MVKCPLSRSFRAVISVALLAILAYWLPKFCASQTDGFTLLKIRSTLTFNPNWETTSSTDLNPLLNQRFTYLNSGGQSYVFLSDDGKYVVKFFKHHLRRVPWLFDHLPLPAKYSALRELQREKRTSKLLRDFNSYKLAYDELREESGLIYVHLNKTNYLKQTITLVDKLHIAHNVDLDTHEFVIQKRADLAFDHFQTLLDEQKMDQAKEAIDSILHLLVSRCQKGIYDEDPRLHRNLGFMGAQAILIDVGRLRRDPSRTSTDVYFEDVRSITDELHTWLQKRNPELANYLNERILLLK